MFVEHFIQLDEEIEICPPYKKIEKVKYVWPQKMYNQTVRTNAPTGRVDRNWTESGGKAP